MRRLNYFLAALAVCSLCMAGISHGSPSVDWSVNAGINIPWRGDRTFGAGEYLYDSTGTRIRGTDGLLIQLVIDVGNDTLFGDMISSGMGGIGTDTVSHGGVIDTASDDVVGAWLTGTWSWIPSAYTSLASYDSHFAPSVTSDVTGYENSHFYFRWFNTATETAGSEFGIIYDAAGDDWVSPANETVNAASVDVTYGSAQGLSGSALTTGSDPGAGWQSVAAVPEPGTWALFGLGVIMIGLRRKLRK